MAQDQIIPIVFPDTVTVHSIPLDFYFPRLAASIDLPLGDANFLDHLEALTGRRLKRERLEPRPKINALSP